MRRQTSWALALGTMAVVVSLATWHFLPAVLADEKKVVTTIDPGAHGHAYEHCAKACNECQRICDACSTHCADMIAEGHKDHRKSLQTCQDCASICSTAAQIVARRGPYSDLICQSCESACSECNKACEQFPDDKMMKECAEECRRCAKACHEMLEHTGKGKAARR